MCRIACQAQYELCAADREADWTYFCPPAMLTPGERLGRYRVGSDTLVVDDSGNSAISMSGRSGIQAVPNTTLELDGIRFQCSAVVFA